MKYIVMVIEDLGEIRMFKFPTIDTAFYLRKMYRECMEKKLNYTK